MPERNISEEEKIRWQTAESATDTALKGKWRQETIDKRLNKLGVNKNTLETLGLEGVMALLAPDTAEKAQRLVASKEVIKQTLEEIMNDPEAKEIAMFRLENVRQAHVELGEIEETRERSWGIIHNELGEHEAETRRAEYEEKLAELNKQLKVLEKIDPENMSADKTNELKKVQATIMVMEAQIAGLDETDNDLIHEERDIIREHQRKMQEMDSLEAELRQSNPEAFLALNFADFVKYAESMDKKQLVETPYVKEHLEDVETHLRSGVPVMIYGHLGSGKTELAMHLAKTKFALTAEQKKNKVPEFYMISGSKHIVPSELYGHQILSIPGMDALTEGGLSAEQVKKWQKQMDQVDDEFKKWLEAHPQATEAESNRQHQTMLELYCAQMGKGTISDYVLGPVYKAMKEGRPLIIDEVNAIPHEVLISLNYLMTRKPGDVVIVQQDSGMKVKVKKGFCIMLTGNLNQGTAQYEDRAELDPAFLSRMHRVEYDYLPQEKEGILEDKSGPQNELYQLVLSKISSPDGTITAPADTLEKLWKLSQAARLIQDVFAGKEVNSAYYFQEAGGRSTQYMLKKSVLSLRDLGRVIDAWKGDNYNQELDVYLYKDFVGEATDLNDRAYLYQVLQRVYGFFKTDGWEQNPSYGTGGKVSTFNIKPPKKYVESPLQYFGPREVTETAFGKAPERQAWPEHRAEAKGEGNEVIETMAAVERLKAEIENLKTGLPEEVAKHLDIQ